MGTTGSKEDNAPTVLNEKKKNFQIQKQIKVEEKCTQIKEEKDQEEEKEEEIKPQVNIAEFSKPKTAKAIELGKLTPTAKFVKAEPSLKPLAKLIKVEPLLKPYVNPRISRKKNFWCKLCGTKKENLDNSTMSLADGGNQKSMGSKLKCTQDDNFDNTELLMPLKNPRGRKKKENTNINQILTRSAKKMKKQRLPGRTRKCSTKNTQPKKSKISNRKKTTNELANYRMTLRNNIISGKNQQNSLSQKLQPKLCLKRLNFDKYLKLNNGSYKVPICNKNKDDFVKPFTIKVEKCEPESSGEYSKSKDTTCDNISKSTEKSLRTKRLHSERFIQPKVRVKRLKLDSATEQEIVHNSLLCVSIPISNPITLQKSIEEIVEPLIQIKIETCDEETPNEMMANHNNDDALNISNSSSKTTYSDFLIQSVRSIHPSCLSDVTVSSKLDTSDNDTISNDSGYVSDSLIRMHIAMQRAVINMMLLESGYSPLQFNLLNSLDQLQIFLDYLLVR